MFSLLCSFSFRIILIPKTRPSPFKPIKSIQSTWTLIKSKTSASRSNLKLIRIKTCTSPHNHLSMIHTNNPLSSFNQPKTTHRNALKKVTNIQGSVLYPPNSWKKVEFLPFKLLALLTVPLKLQPTSATSYKLNFHKIFT